MLAAKLFISLLDLFAYLRKDNYTYNLFWFLK